MNENQQLQFIKSVAALATGTVLIIFAYSILIRMIMFCLGCGLIFYGVNGLNIPALTSIMKTIKTQFTKLFN